ncbi:MAG: 4Fe-4S binding protein [Desulfobacula sp.]|nr:4Fe-4S binding protein [Desulfobacula sp.]
MIKKIQNQINIGTLISPRVVLQIASLIIVLSIGIKFYNFITLLEKGIIPDFARPPGVEAFLPISALVSLKHLLFTGTINAIHPSGLVLFLIICLTAVLVKKGFCSWICPIGFLSDLLTKLHVKIFKKKLNLPVSVDLLLRSIKYLLAGFFIWSIFYKMPIISIEQFIQSPYNRFADVKMLKFFTDISNTALTVIITLSFLSLIIPYFWCRYLCPYGAVLGALSFFSFGKIKRDPANCIDCGRCEKNCPGLIKIRQKTAIHSSECSACMTCIKNCPEKGVLNFSFFPGKRAVGQSAIATIFVCLFFMGISLAKISDNWHNKITKSDYLQYIQPSAMPSMPWGLKGKIAPEKMERMMRRMMELQKQSQQ